MCKVSQRKGFVKTKDSEYKSNILSNFVDGLGGDTRVSLT